MKFSDTIDWETSGTRYNVGVEGTKKLRFHCTNQTMPIRDICIYHLPPHYCMTTGSADAIAYSCSTSNAVTAVVSCAVSFIVTALVGTVVHYCAVRKKCDCQKLYSLTIARKQQQQQPAPVYDDIVGQSQNIELKENVAYGPVQQ